MLDFPAQMVTNAAGESLGVFLDMDFWRALQVELEKLNNVRAFDQARADLGGAAVPLEEVAGDVEPERGRQLPPPAV